MTKRDGMSSLNQAGAEHSVKGGPGQGQETRRQECQVPCCPNKSAHPCNSDVTRHSRTSERVHTDSHGSDRSLTAGTAKRSQVSPGQQTQTVTEFRP